MVSGIIQNTMYINVCIHGNNKYGSKCKIISDCIHGNNRCDAKHQHICICIHDNMGMSCEKLTARDLGYVIH